MISSLITKNVSLLSIVCIFDTDLKLDLNENKDSFKDRPKTFIAISTVMTWARTKPENVYLSIINKIL